MPIEGEGWEIHFLRTEEQRRGSRVRTVGTYRIFHDGTAQTFADAAGMFAETRGPGNNGTSGINKRRIETGRYPIWSQDGTSYKTWGFRMGADFTTRPRPGVELKETDQRTEILIHPGSGFLRSTGCINLCTSLPDASEDITFSSSRRRVLSMIMDMIIYAGHDFPKADGLRIPECWAVVDGEPDQV